MLRYAFAILCASTIFVAASARAQDGDGLYDRFDSDTWFSLTAAASSVPSSSFERTSFAPELRARYLDSAGLFVAMYLGDGPARVMGGVDLRPLFLGRFLTGRVLGRAFFDLLLDSIGLDLGVSTYDVNGRMRAALVIGTGLDVPLYFSSSTRVSLRLSMRYLHADVAAQVATELSLQAGLTLALGVDTGLAAREGPRTRF